MVARFFTFNGEFTGEGADLPRDIALLDALSDISHEAYHAYGLRRLTVDYTGPAITVRRSSDNTTANIGWVGYQLDTAALLDFVGAGDGFVTQWYDQSGNTRHMAQSTTTHQPRIVDDGVITTMNGVPTVDFRVTATACLKHESPGLGSLFAADGATIAVVSTDEGTGVTYAEGKATAATGNIRTFWRTASGNRTAFYAVSNTNTVSSSGGNAYTTSTTLHSDVMSHKTGQNVVYRRNGAGVRNSAWSPTLPTSLLYSALGGLVTGNANPSDQYQGRISEHILLTRVATTEAAALINANHTGYYTTGT